MLKIATRLDLYVSPNIAKDNPSAKELRMRSFMAEILDHSDFTIQGNTIINHRPKGSDGKQPQ